MNDTYANFLNQKRHFGTLEGFKPIWMPKELFDFQEFICDWIIRKGRGAVYADCGMGKSVIQLTWLENVVRHTNKPVMLFLPLAVIHQTIKEGTKFGIECKRAVPGKTFKGINAINYEQTDKFDPNDYIGIAADESSILKSYDGVRRSQITEFMKKIKYRSLYTATPSPNDYFELGTNSEALGYLGYMDMLVRFFKNQQGNSIAPFRLKLHPTKHQNGVTWRDISGTDKWVLKGHAEEAFWRWVCSWAIAARKPSDLGFDDGKFILPKLTELNHIIPVSRKPASGTFFTNPAISLHEQRVEKRETLVQRCEKTAEIISKVSGPSIMWCQLNDEGDLLEELVSNAIQVSGADSDEAKEEKFMAFVNGEAKDLITKAKIGAWGLNLQHCADMTMFPSHSYEQRYQAIRRCWRFGQKKKVTVHTILSEGETRILTNQQRKVDAADKMFSKLIGYFNGQIAIDGKIDFTTEEELPKWL